jgi:hypothetical protein
MYIAQDYTFLPGPPGEGIITIPSVLKLEDFGTITNVTRNSVLYDPAEGDAGATIEIDEGDTVLTLEQSTTYCDSGDKLQIVVLGGSAPEGGATELTLQSIDNKIPELSDGTVPVSVIAGLDIPTHDYISLSYTDQNLTGVIYKQGGSGGLTVASLALTYDVDNNLTSVSKT